MLSKRTLEFIETAGRDDIAKAMDVHPDAVRHYTMGRKEMRPRRAAALIRFARSKGLMLDYADIYGDPLTRPSEPKKELAE